MNNDNERESNNKVNKILIGIILILLVFFLGQRYIERRSTEEIMLYSQAIEKSIPRSPEENESNSEDISSEKININTASAEELQKLDGIGEKKAEAIIHYRYVYGDFTDISEIMNVDGIGSGTYEKIKDKITV